MQAKGSSGLLALQYEEAFTVAPGTPDLTKIYFESEGFKASKNLVSSSVLTGSRQPSAPIPGNIDASGSLSTELQAYTGKLFYGAAGSIKTEANSGTGEALGAALTTPAAVISTALQTMVVTVTSHGLVVGDTVQIAGLTAPTSLNSTYCRVIQVVDANNFILRIPKGTTSTFTLGSGTLKKVTTPATTYKHTILFGGALPSFLVEKGFPDIGQYFKYNGCKIGKMSLNATPEGFQKVSFDFAAVKETTGSSTFDSIVTDLGKSSFSGFNIGSIEVDGISAASITKIDFSVENGLDTGIYTIGGAGLRASIPEGTCKVTGTVEALFENLTYYTLAVLGSETSINLVYNLGAGSGVAGHESFTIKIPELIFKQDTPTISGDKGVLISLPFEAYYANSAEGAVAQIILKNSQLSI